MLRAVCARFTGGGGGGGEPIDMVETSGTACVLPPEVCLPLGGGGTSSKGFFTATSSSNGFFATTPSSNGFFAATPSSNGFFTTSSGRRADSFLVGGVSAATLTVDADGATGVGVVTTGVGGAFVTTALACCPPFDDCVPFECDMWHKSQTLCCTVLSI